jgi:hypothetical protein
MEFPVDSPWLCFLHIASVIGRKMRRLTTPGRAIVETEIYGEAGDNNNNLGTVTWTRSQ